MLDVRLSQPAERVGARPARVQSLDRGLQLLEYLSAAREPAGLTELASVIGVDRSTAHRLLGTLVQRGFVSQDARSRRYRQGLKVVELSRQALGSLGLRAASRGILRELVRQSGETANLVVRDADRALCVDLEPSPSILAVTNEMGTVFPLHATAAGKILLAAASDSERAAWLTGRNLAGFTPRTLTVPGSLAAHLQQVRRQGYAVDDEESHLGVRCVAAPVCDHHGAVVAALSASGPAMRVTLETLPGLVALVRRAAGSLSAALGGPSDMGF